MSTRILGLLRPLSTKGPMALNRPFARPKSIVPLTTSHSGATRMRFNSTGPSNRSQYDEEARREAFMRGLNRARQARDQKYVSTLALYSASVVIGFLALAYASVPLYRALCQRTGYGGNPITDSEKFTPEKMVPVDRKKRIRVSFSSEVSTIMPWKFKPEQREVHVLPGETALAFYKAKNVSDKDIIGMATYSVIPEKAAPYFSKIQCFCFEEQLLRAGEEVDMPVFFFIDPDFTKDPLTANVDDLVLHYTFFKAKYDVGGTLTPVEGSDQDFPISITPTDEKPMVL